MARTPSRFVIPLGDEEREILGYLKDDGETPRIRHRAHAILLSDSGKSVNEIAEIFETTRVTVCSWLVRWEDWGPQGLADNPRTGAPPKLTNSEKKKVVRLINKYPHSPKQVLNEIPSQRSKQLNTLGFLRYDNQLSRSDEYFYSTRSMLSANVPCFLNGTIANFLNFRLTESPAC